MFVGLRQDAFEQGPDCLDRLNKNIAILIPNFLNKTPEEV
jgi:hypothetical protein